MEARVLQVENFENISLADPFFDTLKSDYPGFVDWFSRKASNPALTFRGEDGQLDGFLYLKEENGPITDVVPALESSRRMKIGTFKVNPHGTRLGERFLKRAFDQAISIGAQALYVTVFAKHNALVQLFLRYGFVKVGEKPTPTGDYEDVFERRLDKVAGDVVLDYPRLPFRKDRHFVLALYPKWHSRLLPDSLLRTENSSILADVSHTNSIHKIYLTAMDGVEQLQTGDTILIYRTAENGTALHTSVVTSICVVEEISNLNEYETEAEFLDHCSHYSIFTISELRDFYKTRKYPWVIRFTYNLALTKRPNRKSLIEQVGLNANRYWGFFQISTHHLREILKLSGDYEKARALVYPS